jgi:hypothetical protein
MDGIVNFPDAGSARSGASTWEYVSQAASRAADGVSYVASGLNQLRADPLVREVARIALASSRNGRINPVERRRALRAP